MKIAKSFLAFLATALVVATSAHAEPDSSPLKNDAPNDKENAVVKDDRELHEDGPEEAGPEGYRPIPRPRPGPTPYYKPYFTGSCTCAQDAWMEIMAAASDAIADCIPLEESAQDTLPPYINALEHCAIEWLSGLDCGCDDDYKIPLPSKSRKRISTYQCCCDVHAVKDIVIQHITEIKNSWMAAVDMHGDFMPSVIGKICEFDRYDAILERVTYAIKHILAIYAHGLFYGSPLPECELAVTVDCPSTETS